MPSSSAGTGRIHFTAAPALPVRSCKRYSHSAKHCRSANFAATLREAAAGFSERHERRRSVFFQLAQPFGRPARPAGCHQFERTPVIRIRQFGGQVAARLLTAQAFNDQMHVQRLRQQCNGRPAYARNVAGACAANVTGQDTFSRLGSEVRSA